VLIHIGFTVDPTLMKSLFSAFYCRCQLIVFTVCQQMILQQTDIWCMSSDRKLNSNNSCVHWCMSYDDGAQSQQKCSGVEVNQT